MEVKMHFKDGSVEQHMIPELVGVTTSIYESDASKESGSSSLDMIADVVERLYRNEQGFFLERYTVSLAKETKNGVERLDKPVTQFTNASRGNCILPAARLEQVKMILVDGEQVYPDVEPEVDLKELMDEL